MSKTDASIIAEKNLVYSKRALFSQTTGELNFSIHDLTNTNNILLSFKSKQSRGKIVVTLNGQQIFNAPASEFKPLTLPKNMLSNDNQLLFMSSSPGLAFWSTHESLLEQVQVVADIVDRSAQSAKHTFLISDVDFIPWKINFPV